MGIRTVKREDYQSIDQLIRDAFTHSENGYGDESELVDKIRKSDSYISDLEVVLTKDKAVIGHGLLSQVEIVNDTNSYRGLVLAPLGTKRSHQRQGVGKKIMRELEDRAKKLNYGYISILGHATYYSRLGYLPASNFDVKAPFEVPDEAFMIKPLFEGSLDKVSGTIKYSSAFE